MIDIIKNFLKVKLNNFGYSIIKNNNSNDYNYVELSSDEIEIIRNVFESKYSMTSIPRLVATLKACKYVVEEGIDGDFVECGVWRGGNAIIAKKIFEKLGSDKQLYLFDTFLGMTEPTEVDKDFTNNVSANERYIQNQEKDYNKWCYASLEDVKNNFKDMNLSIDGVNFIKGDVKETLSRKHNIPTKISVLRLDTDWYESTLLELNILYPILSHRGNILIDDYGHWQGSKKAVDEYFEKIKKKPLFNVTDYTGRSAIKI